LINTIKKVKQMAITVEYGKCDQCGDNNVKTAQVCRSCTKPLPWSRAASAPAASQGMFEKPKNPILSFPGFSAGFYVQVLGGIVFVAGVFLWLGNVIGFFPTFPRLGYITGFIGSVIWGTGAAMDNYGAND
jgi:hypothetical protein